MMMRGTREPVRCILLSLVLVMAGAAALAQDAPRQATPRRNAVRPIEGRVSSNPRPAPTPAGDIFLEGHTITRQERSAVARHADGTPSRLSADTTATLRRMRVGATDKAVYLVRLNTLRVSEAKSAIEALGGEVLGYVRDAAFQVRMNAATAGRIGTLPQVEWIGPYKPEYKISRQLSDDVRRIQAATGPRAGQADAGSSGRSRSATDSTVEVNIYLFAHAALDRVASTVEALSGQVAGAVANDRLPKVRARISAGDLERVTLLPEVRLIERYVAPQLTNDKATSITRINEVWSSHGLTGAGQIVGHADTGLDVGTTGAAMHDDFEGRIAAAYALGRVGDWSDPQGHGTHTAGTILGNGAKSGGLYAGAAPDAQLVHQSVMDASGGLGGLPLDYGTLFQQAYDAGARIHSDSWGASTFGGYGDAVYLDAWTWNSGSPRNMLVVMAAGNDGPDASTVGSPGTAKNALTVGASETSRPALGSYADDIDEIAAFSSRGPTADGRIKPEVVAPGTWIASPRTQGDITPMEDDFETPLAWTKEPVAAPFTLTTADSRSGAQSYRHQRSGTAMFDDYLISPPLTLPAGNALSVNFWMKGTMTGTAGFDGLWFAFRSTTLGGGWQFVDVLIFFDGTITDWFPFTVPIPSDFLGLSDVEIAFNPYKETGGPATFDLYFDDVNISSFGSWASMAEAGLATSGDTIDQFYTLEGGTSMATPLVAGAAALVRQFFEDVEAVTPSAALTKAMLINGATDPTPGTARPDNNSGWGRIDLENTLYPDAPRLVIYDDSSSVTESAVQTYNIAVTSSGVPLMATLVWMDRDGSTLQNNLDLVLIAPDLTEYETITGPSDSVNSVEGVDIASPQLGTWTVEVRGQSVPFGPQPYALVLAGGISSDSTPPQVTAITSQNTGPTNADSIVYDVTFDEDVSGLSAGAFSVVTVSGTATGSVNATVGGGGAAYTVTVENITGDGQLRLDLTTTTGIEDLAGNPLASGAQGQPSTLDNTPPGVAIGAPSVSPTDVGPIDFVVTYTGASAVNLTTGQVTLNTGGTASASVSVLNGTTATPTVRLSSLSGSGTLGITLTGGAAVDAVGNADAGAGPSTTATVELGPPLVVRVNFAWGGTESGTIAQPYNTLAEAVAAVDAGGTIKIAGGTSAETPRITKAVRIEADGGPAVIGQ